MQPTPDGIIILHNDLNLYAPIVILSIMIGIAAACALMRHFGIRKQTVIYTALLVFVSIPVVSLSLSFSLSGDIRQIGFNGAGGAIGLMAGAFSSIFIHRDHPGENFAIWVIVTPLMYGLSKTACLITGCCNGIEFRNRFAVIYNDQIPRFPVQLLETLVFIAVSAIGFTVFLKTKKWFGISLLVVILSVSAKFGLDYLRSAHYSGQILSSNQILALICGIIAVTLTFIIRKIWDKTRV